MYGPYKPLRYWVQKVLPLVYDNSLSYYELLAKVVAKLNEIGALQNQLIEHFDEHLESTVKEILDDWIESGTIASYLNNLVIVTDYGAKGDGETDDTAAIQRCIDENPGASIYFKKGTYIISDTIDLWGASGGQYVVFGGCTIKWNGEVSQTKPMIRVEKDYDPVISSFCRIVGGNFDGSNKAGIGIQNKAFYTDINAAKIFDFTNYGILNGTLENDVNKSTQAKIHDCHIFMRDDNNWSAEDRIAMKFTYPDNQISNVVTNRCKYAYELVSGGNSFVNCHSTVQYKDGYTLTAETLTGGHILLNPKNSGLVQDNLFTNCYFNVGKYVVHNPNISTNLITHITSSHFTYYGSSSLNFTLEAFLWYGHYGVLKVDGFDIVVGSKCNFRDYFLSEGTPGTTGIPEMNFNITYRHPEADICVANNYISNQSGAHLLSGNDISVPEANQYYEVGGVLFSYVDSVDFNRTFSEAIKVEYDVEYTHCEALINLNADLTVNIRQIYCDRNIDIHQLYAGTLTDKTIGGKTYKYLPFYIYCTGYLASRVFLKLSSMGNNNKCYVVNGVSQAHVYSGTLTGAKRLFEKVLPITQTFAVRSGETYDLRFPKGSVLCAARNDDGGNIKAAIYMRDNWNFIVPIISNNDNTAIEIVNAENVQITNNSNLAITYTVIYAA